MERGELREWHYLHYMVDVHYCLQHLPVPVTNKHMRKMSGRKCVKKINKCMCAQAHMGLTLTLTFQMYQHHLSFLH